MRILIILCVVALAGCGAKAANMPHGVEILAPSSGIRCFAVMDGDRVAGGNCIKE